MMKPSSAKKMKKVPQYNVDSLNFVPYDISGSDSTQRINRRSFLRQFDNLVSGQEYKTKILKNNHETSGFLKELNLPRDPVKFIEAQVYTGREARSYTQQVRNQDQLVFGEPVGRTIDHKLRFMGSTSVAQLPNESGVCVKYRVSGKDVYIAYVKVPK